MKKSVIIQINIKKQAFIAKQERYKGMIGSIIFSIVEIRPDVTFATSVASHFTKNPGHQYIVVVKTIFRYLKGTRDREITYGSLDLEDFSMKG